MALFCLEAWNEDARRLRPCYLFHAPDEAGARGCADILFRSGRLAYLPACPHLRVRQATRGEHGLFDAFLRSLDRTRLDSHTPIDADGLIARRDDAVERFFILMFYAPDAVRSRYGAGKDPAPGPYETPSGTAGSGGVLRDPAEAGSKSRSETAGAESTSEQESEASGADTGAGDADSAPNDSGEARQSEDATAAGGDLLSVMQNAEAAEDNPLDFS